MSDAITELGRAYEAGAESWRKGPEAVYRRLAEALVAESPVPLSGARVLDLGSGTGVASAAARAAGADAVGVDLAWAMLRQGFDERPPGVVGNALALPFAAAAFDAVVAAFCINHFDRPADALAECARVVRSGGAVLASSFSSAREHPAKAAVEAVLARHGYERPEWYAGFKDTAVLATGTADALAQAADEAGLFVVDAKELDVEAGLDEPMAMVDWRLSMPHTIGFVEGLSPDAQNALRTDALAALSTIDPPSTIATLVLTARVA